MGKVWKLLEFSVVMFIVAGDATSLDFSMDIYKHNNGFKFRTLKTYNSHTSARDRVSQNSLKKSSSTRSAIFATENSTIVAQVGGTAKLPCAVRKSANAVVSWTRKQDVPTLLTVGLTTYSANDRIFVEHIRHLQNWSLVIKHVQPSDAGLYECQVSTHPPTSIFVILKVTEASAEIFGAPDLHIRAGSLLTIRCVLRQSTEQPSYVFWFHGSHMINHDPGVSVINDRISSTLQLEEADKSHSGNYTCSPSNAVPAHVNVHVLNATDEEYPAAMVHANCASFTSNTTVTIWTAVAAIFLYILKR